MNTNRTLARVATLVAALVMATLALVGSTSPASAVDNSTKPGFKMVYDRTEYLPFYVHRGVQVLAIDDAHATADGFWFAAAETYSRGFEWYYQPYGMWCGDTNSVSKVAWNGWMNRFMCMVDDATIDARQPGAAATRASCRESTGYPWKVSTAKEAPYDCVDTWLDMRYNPITQQPNIARECAPWEPASCQSITYSWAQDPSPIWQLSPDTCTGMPADSNGIHPAYDPSLYAPSTGGDGTCTGEAFAPNCDEAHADYQACNGIEPGLYVAPQVPQTFTATITETSTKSVTKSSTGTRSASATALRFKKKVTVRSTIGGESYSASSTAKVYRTASRSATVTKSASASASASATKSCTAETQTAAEDCASAQAAEAADAAAAAKAGGVASTNATSAALTAAQASATSSATYAASVATVSQSAKDKAIAVAKKRALAKVRAKARRGR